MAAEAAVFESGAGNLKAMSECFLVSSLEMSREKASLSELVTRWLPLSGLAGLVGAYWFMADAVPALVATSPRLTTILGDSANSWWPYLGVSFLLAIGAAIAPASSALVGSSVFLLILMMATAIAGFLFCTLFLLVVMVGMHQDTFPRMINWMFVSGLFVMPVALLGTGTVWLSSFAGKALQQNRKFRQWEILVLLLGASWLGLMIGWLA